jgi:hypothetical protein
MALGKRASMTTGARSSPQSPTRPPYHGRPAVSSGELAVWACFRSGHARVSDRYWQRTKCGEIALWRSFAKTWPATGWS